MEITEVRVKLVSPGNDKLRAFCSITIDNNFVIRDLKIIEGAKGAFVAMPSRKLTDRCRCGAKNHHRAKFCNECGVRLQPSAQRAPPGRAKLHADIAHPINSRCRELIQERVLDVYHGELTRSSDPDYKPMDLDIFDEDFLAADGSDANTGTDGTEESHVSQNTAPRAPAAPPVAGDRGSRVERREPGSSTPDRHRDGSDRDDRDGSGFHDPHRGSDAAARGGSDWRADGFAGRDAAVKRGGAREERPRHGGPTGGGRGLPDDDVAASDGDGDPGAGDGGRRVREVREVRARRSGPRERTASEPTAIEQPESGLSAESFERPDLRPRPPRRPPDDAEGEPEDNFGAGLLS